MEEDTDNEEKETGTPFQTRNRPNPEKPNTYTPKGDKLTFANAAELLSSSKKTNRLSVTELLAVQKHVENAKQPTHIDYGSSAGEKSNYEETVKKLTSTRHRKIWIMRF